MTASGNHTTGQPDDADREAAARWERVKAVAGEALELGQGRSRFIEVACAGDAVLLSEVRALIEASGALPETLSEQGLPAQVLADALQAPTVFDGTLIGRYRVVKEIGRGGMGAVFEAIDTTLGRTVALKLLPVGFATSGARRRFEGEATALARLDHPGIARVYEAGVHQDSGQGSTIPYFTMAHVEGARTLDAYVREAAPGLRTVLSLMAKVCDAVHHGHQKGVLHRDLKPSNILIDPAGEPKVIDFGVSRLLDAGSGPQPGKGGEIFGTPAYLPPEAFEAGMNALDTRADIYALGVVLYQILSAKHPYPESGHMTVEFVGLVRDGEAPLLGSVRADCRGDVESIVAMATAREPGARYQSVDQFGADLRRVIAHEPILARRTPLPRRAWLFARRNRMLVAGAAAVSLALTLGVAGLIVGLSRARASEHRAIAEADRAKRISAFMLRMVRSADPFKEEPRRSTVLLESLMSREVDGGGWASAARPGFAPTVGDLLATASGQIEGSFPDDPSLQADMAAMLAATSNSIKDPRRTDLYRRAERLLSRAYGPFDARTMAARHGVYHEQVMYAEKGVAATILNDIEALRSRARPEDRELLQALWSLYILSMLQEGRDSEALPLLRTIRSDLDRMSAGDDQYKLGLDRDLLRVEFGEGNVAEALARVPGLLARASALGPASDQARLDVLFDLQSYQRRAGDLWGAMSTLAEGATLASEPLGATVVDTYEWWNNLYFVAMLVDEHVIAEYAARRQVRGAEAMLGPHSLYTTKAYGRLARTLLAQGKNPAEAERMARAAVDGLPEMLAEGEAWALYHELLWAWSVRLQGEPERARRIIRDRMDIEARAGRASALSWVEIVRRAELAQCEMDIAARDGDLAAHAPLIERLLQEGGCYADELGPSWPSVRLIDEARRRFAAMRGKRSG